MKAFTDIPSEQLALVPKPDKRVMVYRNLHKKAWSVKQGTVIFHCNTIVLRDVEFSVCEGGRQRVLREKKKYVHAFVKGFICEEELLIGDLIHYNPYTCEKFMMGEFPTESCNYVMLWKMGENMVVTEMHKELP